jgi:hypothetical protein
VSKEGHVYRSGVRRREALIALVLSVVLLGPYVWVAVRHWPLSGYGAALLLGAVVFNVFILWDVFLAPANEVRVGGDEVVFKSPVQETVVRLADHLCKT